MKWALFLLLFSLSCSLSSARDFGDFAPDKATKIKVINFPDFFNTASPITVQSALEQLAASYPIVSPGPYLQLNFLNTEDETTAPTRFDRINNNRLDLYVGSSLIHTWERVVAVVPPAPPVPAPPDVTLTYENDIDITYENDIDLILE